jgi:hypothetical protein
MDPISLLRREDLNNLTPEEDAALSRELSDAYHMDESAASSRDVQRIAEKVRLRLAAFAEQSPAHSLIKEPP